MEMQPGVLVTKMTAGVIRVTTTDTMFVKKFDRHVKAVVVAGGLEEATRLAAAWAAPGRVRLSQGRRIGNNAVGNLMLWEVEFETDSPGKAPEADTPTVVGHGRPLEGGTGVSVR